MNRLELIMTDAHRPLGPDDVEALLKRAERPTAPDDMLAKVRARLAAERAPSPELPSSTPELPSPSSTWPEGDDTRAPRPWLKWGVEGLLAAAAVAALVVAVQLGESIPRGGSPAAEAAGIGAEDSTVVDVRLVARGLDEGVVRRLASDAGLSGEEGAEGISFEGGAHDVRRFLVSLRVHAARVGVEVSGFVPEAGRLRITVVTE